MKKVKLNSGHYHEVLDRTHIVLENIDDHILSHPAVERNKKIKNKIEKAMEQLGKAYQLIGQKL